MCRMTGYSRLMPFAPRMLRASRAMRSASRALLSFPIEIWVGVIRPASLSRPSCRASSCALVISVSMPTSFSWVSWNPPMGRSNWIRVRL